VKEPEVSLTVAAALLKGRNFDAIVRDVTMVGAVAVQPLTTSRTEARGRYTDRWNRIAVASAKQCRRAVVPEIREPQALNSLFQHDRSELRLLLTEPGAFAELGRGNMLNLATKQPPSSATLVIGPEGGWSGDEVDAAQASGFVPVTFGRLTLRADAVVVSAVSVLQYIWGDL
jgi:16S rRNA (uracil1498-N3)-methyltransferase